MIVFKGGVNKGQYGTNQGILKNKVKQRKTLENQKKKKNILYGRRWISWRVQIVVPIDKSFFWAF